MNRNVGNNQNAYNNYDKMNMGIAPNAINNNIKMTPVKTNSDFINFSELKIENSEVRWSGFISKKGEKIQCDCRQIWGTH